MTYPNNKTILENEQAGPVIAGRRAEDHLSLPKQSFWRTAWDNLATDWWLSEILAALLSLFCMGAILVLLWRYNGKPLGGWSGGITLNTVVSVLSTVAKSALAMAVSASLGQGKWVWFIKRQHPLSEFATFDNASRGPIGSFQLLWLTKGR